MALLRALSSLALGRALVGASVMGIGALAAVAIIDRKTPERSRADEASTELTAVKSSAVGRNDLSGDKDHSKTPVISESSNDKPAEDAFGIVNHAAGILLAAFARRRRIQAAPWLAVSATVAAAPAALTAMRYFYYQVPQSGQGSAFRTADGLAHIAAFAYTCYESSKVMISFLKKTHRKL